ncbi:unnamed protein product [Vitrella brassicaformis CCMP3155]|uniref:PDEase domain-containing protein n=2 Tax=Vitrella brassicaformis TaxID=1169539 RepID=A0A0G4EUW5_VITBC|nr:unnamed protein product [Vitrella brassicaformis CCMP3155]|mmetsp:Transcript_32958/g.81622  ORF Transcript_32958/g.81622 Transcript_32958/m.81622 type:complete len:375 (+) Transcript_32958:449-1573(+)|eukprot:CEM02044.1 unnamed protein product [Vitrella brassicaformis CCMP3155]
MKKHFEFVAKYRAHFAKYLTKDPPAIESDSDSASRLGLKWGSTNDLAYDWPSRLLMFKMLTKCADLGHAGKPRELHEQWSVAIAEEFFRQGDLEKVEGLPVSPLCDRDEVVFEKSQSEFIRVICIPLFSALADVVKCPSIDKALMQQARQNRSHWQWQILCLSASVDKGRSSICGDKERDTSTRRSKKGMPQSLPATTSGNNSNNNSRESVILEHIRKKALFHQEAKSDANRWSSSALKLPGFEETDLLASQANPQGRYSLRRSSSSDGSSRSSYAEAGDLSLLQQFFRRQSISQEVPFGMAKTTTAAMSYRHDGDPEVAGKAEQQRDAEIEMMKDALTAYTKSSTQESADQEANRASSDLRSRRRAGDVRKGQ